MLHTLHRTSAGVIGAFVAVHILNHLLAIHSVDLHVAFMEAFRQVYRHSVIEVILLGCVVFQIGSGMYFVLRRWGQRRGFFERLQAISGGYLAFFLSVHVSAVLFGRLELGLDTNFYYAAAGMHVPPFHIFFLPYYFLAVVALFGHLACAFHWLARNRLSGIARDRVGYASLAVGVLASALIVSAFAGVFYPVDVPLDYQATYRT